MNKATKAQLKQVRELLREKRSRDESGLFVGEGFKIIGDMLDKGHIPEFVLISADFADDENNRSFLVELEKRAVPFYGVGSSEFEKISSLRHSQGILAVARKPVFSAAEVGQKDKQLIVLCDGIQDPGNLGAMIRTSCAFGADLLMLSGESADVYNPKVVRASSGIILDIPVVTCVMEDLDRLKNKGYRLLVSSVPGDESAELAKMKDLPDRLIVAFGSEGKGVSGDIMDRADAGFHISISDNVESLNVAAAAAVTLYVLGQRKKTGGG